jgi:hypothetical protein
MYYFKFGDNKIIHSSFTLSSLVITEKRKDRNSLSPASHENVSLDRRICP